MRDDIILTATIMLPNGQNNKLDIYIQDVFRSSPTRASPGSSANKSIFIDYFMGWRRILMNFTVT